jgi:hypothetical protein
MIENKLVPTNAGDFLLRKLRVVPEEKQFGGKKKILSDRGAYCPFSHPMLTAVEQKTKLPADKGRNIKEKDAVQTDTYIQPNPCGSHCPHFNLSENGETLQLTCGSGGIVKISNPEIVNEIPKEKSPLKVSK